MGYASPPSAEEVTSVREVVASFLKAQKKYALYPQNHPSAQKNEQDVYRLVDNFLRRHKVLRFDIEKDRLLYRDIPVYEAQPDSENFAFILFRDGLLWLQFEEGLTAAETGKFIAILSENLILHEEAEGDIVTALWEENLSHISYDAAEVFFEDVSLLDFSALNSPYEGQADGAALAGYEGGSQAGSDSLSALPASLDRNELLLLTPEEHKILAEQVLEAEKDFQPYAILDVLLLILIKQDTPKDFNTVLNFLKEESRALLAKGKYAIIARLISTIRNLGKTAAVKKPWYVASIDPFILEISEREYLSVLKPFFLNLRGHDPENLRELEEFLRVLHPRAIEALGDFLPITDVPQVIEMLLEAITSLARQDVRQVAVLLANEDERIVIRGLQVLAAVPGKTTEDMVTGFLNHSSPRVRRQALRCLMGKNTDKKKLFSLIDDPDATVRDQVLAHVASERDVDMEILLLDYLQKNNTWSGAEDSSHLVECYRALGKCGSKRSLPFLKEMLFKKSWLDFFIRGESESHTAAALALSNLDLDEASALLQKGASSLQAATRKACNKVLGVTSK